MLLKFSLFWRFQIVGWIAFFFLVLPTKWVITGSFLEAVGSFLLRDGCSFLLTLPMRHVYRRIYRGHQTPAWIVGSIAVASVLAALLQLPVLYGLEGYFPFEESIIFGQLVLLAMFYYRVCLFACWSVLYFGIKVMQGKAEREVRLAQTVAERRGVELQRLRALMNSHFMFNALNTVLSALEQQRRGVIKMVQSLADYLNYSLRHKDDDFVFLGDEADALGDYLVLEKARLGTILNIACQIDDSVREIRVPGVILQPLVENAIKFGCATCSPPVVVRIAVRRQKSELLIEVANTGKWIEPEEKRICGGLGLANIRQRLDWLYDDRYYMEILSEQNWVSVQIRIPAES